MALASRVIHGAAGRLDRLQVQREAQAVNEAERRADEIGRAIEAMIGDWPHADSN
jgi:hypothetical protein